MCAVGVCSLANYSLAYEETQSNRVSDFHFFFFFFFFLSFIVLNLSGQLLYPTLPRFCSMSSQDLSRVCHNLILLSPPSVSPLSYHFKDSLSRVCLSHVCITLSKLYPTLSPTVLDLSLFAQNIFYSLV